jgi:hypothetical protein
VPPLDPAALPAAGRVMRSTLLSAGRWPLTAELMHEVHAENASSFLFVVATFLCLSRACLG